jgi:hypothetical protein
VTLGSKTGTYSAAGTTDATGKAVLSGESSSDPAAYAAQFEAAPAKPKSLIPEKYGKADTSGLTLTVGDSAIDQKFDLTD